MMFLLLFIVLPAADLALLIQIGKVIGTFETLGLIFVTGVIGASLARHQGLQVLQRAQTEMQQGRVPSDNLADGMIILIAAALLITPGVITDAIGFLCLIPATRRGIKALVWKWFEHKVHAGQAQVYVFTSGQQPPRRDSDIAAEYEVLREDADAKPQMRNAKEISNAKSQTGKG
jgi:UPF0716 protein FxsA